MTPQVVFTYIPWMEDTGMPVENHRHLTSNEYFFRMYRTDMRTTLLEDFPGYFRFSSTMLLPTVIYLKCPYVRRKTPIKHTNVETVMWPLKPPPPRG